VWPSTVESRRRLKWGLAGSALWLHGASLVEACSSWSFTEEHASPSEHQRRASITSSLPSDNAIIRLREQPLGHRKQEQKSQPEFRLSALRNNHIQGSKIFTWLSRHKSSSLTTHTTIAGFNLLRVSTNIHSLSYPPHPHPIPHTVLFR
jgi:hypothetical protein